MLAEPGGGKTKLLGSLASQLGTTPVTANKFWYMGAQASNAPLVIDAFDELAKIDASGIYKLLGKASATNPAYVVVSSRSSEWDNTATNAFKDFLGQTPLVVRLCEFDLVQQRAIFEHYAPAEDFIAFHSEIARFDLDILLPNPQFLELFTEAYIQSGRRFTDKRSIFERAVEGLAKELNEQVSIKSSLPFAKKIEIASEVFAKLLLSGAEGIGTHDALEARIYPILASLVDSETMANSILSTRLFKPGDSADQHRPAHKIISEYCAANYLTKRIASSTDPLTLHQCLAIIAPNSTVRDELRGLLGWMASLGNKSIQETAIDLDAYAVLANGDPSQLAPSSKRMLLNCLQDIESKDPYFRRGDFWRRFSVAGFFTEEVVNDIRPLLMSGAEGHLRDLILELLVGSPVINQLSAELRQLALAKDESENTRLLANKCLLDLADHDNHADLAVLIFEASNTSLRIAAKTIETLRADFFTIKYLTGFLRVCANLYPRQIDHLERVVGTRYFVKKFIDAMDLTTIELLLDELTNDLICHCAKEPYECVCRVGKSKIIGLMLDHYFLLTKPPYDPKRVWTWVKNLNFHLNIGKNQSKSVQVMQENNELRQGILAHVFGELNDRKKIRETEIHKFDLHSHSGLVLNTIDQKFLVDLAFKIDNPDLWASFIARHQYHRNDEKRGADSLRCHMRQQALANPVFMKEWAKYNRAEAQFKREHLAPNRRRNRKIRHHRKKRESNRATNIKYLQDNREFVETGCDFSFLARFAELVLFKPEKIDHEFGDESLVRNALRNCIYFIASEVPNLQKLAKLQCAFKSTQSEMILFAACLEILRAKGSLESVDIYLLTALRTNIHMGYSAVHEEERNQLKTEVDRLIFPNTASARDFLRQYVEPQLEIPGCKHPEVWLLRSDEVFAHSRAKLSIEWLRRFCEMDIGSLETLFEIAADHADHKELEDIITERCTELTTLRPISADDEATEQKRIFWFLRAWYFLDNPPEACWSFLKANKNTVLSLNHRSGRMSFNESPSWPKLTAGKIELILDAFIDKWPKTDLPSQWGSESPNEETAYRFLNEIIWQLSSVAPEQAIPVLERLIADSRFTDMHKDLKSIHAGQVKNRALSDFEAPTPSKIVELLDQCEIVSVEGLRALLVDELETYQADLNGSETTSRDVFYQNYAEGKRLGEVAATLRIADRLRLLLKAQGITVEPEKQMQDANRCDLSCRKIINNISKLLVIEVKGQWHKELYTAASTQLHERYSIHPDAEHQGIYLVLWFGPHEKVAGRATHSIQNANELKSSIEKTLSDELRKLIDVFVLDVSKRT
ncbi:hypothetical protein [Halomonas sp. KO116]|uniref:hypothetical protein n=1 Tax=Halomonas sp. KO116 TaxID=1504981 RepID=UPI00191060D0|nr:hypothetical protein [Halomonas sp. KO116]